MNRYQNLTNNRLPDVEGEWNSFVDDQQRRVWVKSVEHWWMKIYFDKNHYKCDVFSESASRTLSIVKALRLDGAKNECEKMLVDMMHIDLDQRGLISG